MPYTLRTVYHHKVAPGRRLVLLLPVATVLAGGCTDEDLVCTDIGWEEGFTLYMRSAEVPALPDALYWFDVVADGMTTRLGARWLNEFVGCKGTEADCTAELEASDGTLFVTLQPDVAYDENEVDELLGFTLYAVWDEGGGPATVEVVGFLEDEQIATGSFSPTYDVWEPNGSGCGVATTASDELALDLP